MKKNSPVRGAILVLLLFSVIAHGAMSESSGENFSDDVSTDQTLPLPAAAQYPDGGNESTASPQSGSIMVSAVTTPGNAPGTSTCLTAFPTMVDEVMPRISGDYVVWIDNGNESHDLFLYQLSTGTEIDLTPDWRCQNVTVNSAPIQKSPAIDGTSIVWQDSRSGTWDIFLYDILSGNETRITENTDASNQKSPDISGTMIVWSDDCNKGLNEDYGVYTYDIYLSLIPPGEELLLSPDMPEVSLENPHISGNYVVCEGLDLQNGTYDVYLCTVEGGIGNPSWTLLTPDTPYTDEKNPDISGNYVVWDGVDQMNSTLDVFLYHIPSGVTTLLSNDTPESNQQNPSIHENKVVWEDSRLNVDFQNDIVLYDISSQSSLFLTPDMNSDQVSPEIYGNRVVWRGKIADGEYDVCLFTSGIEKPDLDADFSATTTAGKSPLAVALNDTSTGEPEFWHWDFGDGTSSHEQNPVHTYAVPGTYDVTLSTGNPYQRDVERKDAFISAGAEPVCRFSADPVSGVAPLVVQFSDVSSGDPETWQWDFGDGTTSDVKTPNYTFNTPGTYNITLTVTNSYGTSTLRKDTLIMVANATTTPMIFDIPGMSIVQNGSNQLLTLDGTVSPPYVIAAYGQELLVYPPDSSGIYEIEFKAGEGGFTMTGTIVSGTISSVSLQSQDIVYYPEKTGHGHVGIFNYSFCQGYYPVHETLNSQVWEGVFPEDNQEFEKALDNYEYGEINDIAYTMAFDGIDPDGGCTITVGVDAAWVQTFGEGDKGTVTIESYPANAEIFIDGVFKGYTNATITGLEPGDHQFVLKLQGYDPGKGTFSIRDERDSIKILRIGDDGSAEVVNTSFLYHDPVQNLDYFQAYSPSGMSKFSVSALGGPENLFRLFYLVIAPVVKPETGGGGGGGSYGGVAGAGSTVTPVQTQTSTPTLTPIPTLPRGAPDSPPTVSGSPTPTNPPDSVTPPVTEVPAVPPTDGAGSEGMVLLKNLAVVFAVVLVALVLYLRWNKREQ